MEMSQWPFALFTLGHFERNMTRTILNHLCLIITQQMYNKHKH